MKSSLLIDSLSVMLLILTFAPMTLISHWTIRIFDFPRAQLGVLAIVLLIANVVQSLFFTGRPVLNLSVFSLTIVTLIQFYWIIPYTVFSKKEMKRTNPQHPGFSLKMLSVNVLQTNTQFHRLIDTINKYQPDIVITLESDAKWESALSSLSSSHPYSVKIPQDNFYGMHLFSKFELTNTHIMYREQENIPSITTDVLLPYNHQKEVVIRTYILHPMPPSPTESPKSLSRDRELITVAREVEKLAMPCLIAGDLNDVAWSKTTVLFRKISKLLDPRIGRGIYSTFHTKFPFLRWPLDHIFASSHFTLNRIARLPSIGSDHFPIFIDMSYQHESNKQSGENIADTINVDDQALMNKRMELNE